jgi:hypothetical protein
VNPCQNDGECQDKFDGTVICDCPYEWLGNLCEYAREDGPELMDKYCNLDFNSIS